MTRLRFYVGGRGQTTGSAHTLLVTTFGGYTLTHSTGAWRAIDGRVHCERSRVYEVLTDSSDSAKVVAEQLARICRQQSVLYTVEDVQGGFT